MNKPIWIVSTPRSGTTYLCDVLNRTGLFAPEFGEHFNLIHGFRGDALRSDPAAFRYCKAFPQQLRGSDLTLRSVSEVLPGVVFVAVRRRSLLDRAVSLYLAERSGVYTVSTQPATGDFASFVDSPEGYLGRQLPSDLTDCVGFYERIKEEEESLRSELSTVEHIEVEYESIMDGSAFRGIFGILGLDSDWRQCMESSPMLPMPRSPEYWELKRGLASILCKV